MALLGNAVGKLTKNADKIGMLVGVFDDGLDAPINNLMRIIQGEGHLPDIARTIKETLARPSFKSAAVLWLAGWAAKEVGYSKYGNPMQKFGEGMMKGLAIVQVLHRSSHGHTEGIVGLFNRSVVAPNQGYSY